MTPVIRAYLRAAAEGDANLVRGLLAQGINVDSVNHAGQTALMLAAGFNRRDVVSLLLAAGANSDLQDDLGLTAVDWAKDYVDIIELFKADANPIEVVAPEASQVEEVSEPVTRPILRPNETPAQRQAAEPTTLKGLAGAILRDHKPKFADDLQSINSAPLQESTPIPELFLEPELVPADDTLDKPISEVDDTAASARPVAARSRIFDLSSTNEGQRPVSKVEVAVPSFYTEQQSRKSPFLWVLLIIAVGAVGFGTYRLGKAVFATSNANTDAPVSTAKPLVQPSPTYVKTAPVVSGDLAGAELYLSDAEYPSALANGQSGAVNVEVQVNQKGIVLAANAIDGEEIFRANAEKAAKSSAFAPDKLADKSRVIEGTITYRFVPGQQSKPPAERGVTAVAGGPLAGKELNLVKPDYPSNAKEEGATGKFTVVVRVNRAGRVMSWRFLDGDQHLRDAMLNAVRRSTFDPSKLKADGEVVGTITYTFN